MFYFGPTLQLGLGGDALRGGIEWIRVLGLSASLHAAKTTMVPSGGIILTTMPSFYRTLLFVCCFSFSCKVDHIYYTV